VYLAVDRFFFDERLFKSDAGWAFRNTATRLQTARRLAERETFRALHDGQSEPYRRLARIARQSASLMYGNSPISEADIFKDIVVA
jgi:hypothetical protein